MDLSPAGYEGQHGATSHNASRIPRHDPFQFAVVLDPCSFGSVVTTSSSVRCMPTVFPMGPCSVQ